MWGFDACGSEIIWYVGKSTPAKSFRRRLREHYLDLLSCKYERPRGFLNGRFDSLGDVVSEWACKHNDQVAEQLLDFDHISKLLKAGHEFGTQAFARIAPLPDMPREKLNEIENAAIFDLQPVVNKRSKSKRSLIRLVHEQSTGEDWLRGWRATAGTLNKHRR
jgi:hypothetical protein